MNGYSVSVIERFRGSPDAKTENVNLSISMSFDSLEDVCAFIDNDMRTIYEVRNVLKETTILEKGKLVKQLLFERVGKHGRLIRTYTVMPNRHQHHSRYDNSLI